MFSSWAHSQSMQVSAWFSKKKKTYLQSILHWQWTIQVNKMKYLYVLCNRNAKLCLAQFILTKYSPCHTPSVFSILALLKLPGTSRWYYPVIGVWTHAQFAKPVFISGRHGNKPASAWLWSWNNETRALVWTRCAETGVFVCSCAPDMHVSGKMLLNMISQLHPELLWLLRTSREIWMVEKCFSLCLKQRKKEN